MGFITDTLFGSGGEAPETQFKQLPTMTGPQQTTLQKLIDTLLPQIGNGITSYDGLFTPGPTNTQQGIYGLVDQLLAGQGPMQQQGMDTVSNLMQPWDKSLATDYWNQSVKKPMMESWNKDIVPGIMEQFAAYDAAGSGPAKQAVSESGRRLDTDIGSVLAQTLLSQENMWNNRALQASGMGLEYGPGLVNKVLPAAQDEWNIGAAQGQEKLNKWTMQQPWANPWLNYINPILNTKTFENVAYQTGGKPAQKGIFGDLLGAAATIGSAFLA